MNVKNLLAGLSAAALAVVVMVNTSVVGAAINDPEFDAAISWMYDNGLTKYNNQDDFMPYATLTREQFAKFGAAYGLTNLCLEVDVDADCDFSDIPADPTLGNYVTLACQLGLVKGSDGKYYPTAPVKKSEVLTVMSRAISAADGEDAPSENMTPWWKGHFDAMRAIGVTKETDVYAVDRSVTRYEVALMLYRSRVEDSTCSDFDLSQLLEDLFGPEDDVDTDDDTVPTSDAEVMAELSANTPDGDTVPGNVSVHVASFDFTAEGDDAVLNSLVLERMGLGDDDVLVDATLFVNNEPVSKSRSFNSDDEAQFSLNPKIDIMEGETVTVDVVVKVGLAVDANGQEFSIALIDFDTNGTDDLSNLPEEGNDFDVANVNGATVIVTQDGSVSDVELGEEGAEVAKFEIENDSNDAVFITQITLEDDEKNAEDDLTNFVLTHDGDEIATTENANGKYVTFMLDEPLMIDENESESFRVMADVIAGAGDQIAFLIDEEIYVMGYDDGFGFGLDVDANWTIADPFDINAGEVTFVEQELTPDEIRADRDEVTLALFDVNINAGQDLSLEDISFTVDAPGFGGDSGLDTYFENVQLVVTIDGDDQTYDVDVTQINSGTFTAGDDDLGIFLPDTGEISIALIADTVSTIDNNAIGEEFMASLNVGTDVEIIENEDDEEVTDIVPSSMTFDTLTFVETSIDINSINLSNVDVVIGADNVDAVLFEVETDDVSSALVEGFTFTASGTITVDQNLITALRLWMQTDDGWELLDEESGFDIDSEIVTFDSFDDVIVDAASEQLFLLTVDVIDNDTIAGETFSWELTSSDIEDDDNVQLCNPATSCNADSTRDITVNGAGDLDVSVDTSEEEVDDSQFVLGGESQSAAPFVASFELVADNEGVIIEDLTIVASGAGAVDFEEAIMEVVLYADDMTTVIDSQTVTSTGVDFDNIDLELDEGSNNIWVKVVADLIGDEYEGTTTDDITLYLVLGTVEGADSGDDVTPTYDGVARTLESNPFQVVPVKFSDADFVLSSNGYVVDTSTSNGTDVNIAILQLTADTWSNTQESPVGSLELIVNELVFVTSNDTDVTDYEIRRVGNGSTDWLTGVLATGSNTVTFDLTTATLNTTEFVSSEVGYYVIRADINAA